MIDSIHFCQGIKYVIDEIYKHRKRLNLENLAVIYHIFD